MQGRVETATRIIGPAELRKSVAALEEQTLQAGFWDAQAEAQRVMTRIAACKEDVATVDDWHGGFQDAEAALELAAEESGVRRDLRCGLRTTYSSAH